MYNPLKIKLILYRVSVVVNFSILGSEVLFISQLEIIRFTFNALNFSCSFFYLVYDTSSRETFDKLEEWLNEVETYSTKKDIIKMLVGNKIDKVNLSLISTVLIFYWRVSSLNATWVFVLTLCPHCALRFS